MNVDLLSRKTLAKNSVINLIGFAAPLVVGLVAIPPTISGFGVDRFGLLTLAWAVIGYFSLFDMGIGRAITQSMAQRLASASERDVSKLVWTGLLMMLCFALIGASAVGVLTPWFLSHVLKIPSALREEAIHAFWLLAAAIPAVVLSAGLIGILAALQRFDLINALRIPMGMMMFVVPLAILPFSRSVASVCAALLAIRILFLSFYAVACARAYPPLRSHIGGARSEIRGLLRYGGWMTVTNIVGPLMMYMDRFVIGSLLTISVVAYYVTPYEMISRLLAIPTALAAVLFPAFAAANASQSGHAGILYSTGGRAVLLFLAPIVLVVVLFSAEGLKLWLGDDFAKNGSAVLQWLAIGMFLNSYSQIPFTLIQGVGRADITAKLHLFELPVYVALIYGLIGQFGITGAAMAWTLRAGLDAFLLTIAAHRQVSGLAYFSRQTFPSLLLPLTIFAIGMSLDVIEQKLAFAGVALLVLGIFDYYFATTQEEKNILQRAARGLFRH